jgi:hypothetical protein
MEKIDEELSDLQQFRNRVLLQNKGADGSKKRDFASNLFDCIRV